MKSIRNAQNELNILKNDVLEIKENDKFKTLTGRIGSVYALTKRNIEEGTVNLFFEGSGDIYNNPPCGIFKIATLERVE